MLKSREGGSSGPHAPGMRMENYGAWSISHPASHDMINQRHLDPSSVSEDQFCLEFDVFWQATAFTIFYRYHKPVASCHVCQAPLFQLPFGVEQR